MPEGHSRTIRLAPYFGSCCFRMVTLHRPLDRLCNSQVVQYEQRAVSIKLRTPSAVEHLHLSWHQTAARLCLGPPPDRGAVSEAFAFGADSQKCMSPAASTRALSPYTPHVVYLSSSLQHSLMYAVGHCRQA